MPLSNSARVLNVNLSPLRSTRRCWSPPLGSDAAVGEGRHGPGVGGRTCVKRACSNALTFYLQIARFLRPVCRVDHYRLLYRMPKTTDQTTGRTQTGRSPEVGDAGRVDIQGLRHPWH